MSTEKEKIKKVSDKVSDNDLENVAGGSDYTSIGGNFSGVTFNMQTDNTNTYNGSIGGNVNNQSDNDSGNDDNNKHIC